MRRLIAFLNVSLDGYFTDSHGDMSWAHKQDAEWNAFVQENAGGGGELVFGRATYEMMVSFWPTPQAFQMMPTVAEGMNQSPKIVFSTRISAARKIIKVFGLCPGIFCGKMANPPPFY